VADDTGLDGDEPRPSGGGVSVGEDGAGVICEDGRADEWLPEVEAPAEESPAVGVVIVGVGVGVGVGSAVGGGVICEVG
jgi:hypothetical protein